MTATWKNAALAALASVFGIACAHAPGDVVVVVPPGDPEHVAPTPAVIAAWGDAAALFAEHDRAGRWDGEACHASLAAFERVNETRGNQDARAVYMAGLIASRCGNADGARRLYTRALELDPALCEPRVALGLVEMDAGRPAPAQRAFEVAIEHDNRCAPAYVNLAILQARRPEGRPDAIANLRRALAVRADYLPALDQLALIYLDGARSRDGAGSQGVDHPELLDLAEVVCRQAQLIDDGYAPIYNTWALIDVAQGDITGAAAKLERAVRLDPSFFAAHMNFGQITLSQRAYEDAARAFARARELRPSSYDAAIGEGVARRALSSPDDAERLYRAALQLDDARPEAYFDLAVLYQEHRDGTVEQLEQAEAFLSEFVARARAVPSLSDELAGVLRWCEDAPSPRAGTRSAWRRPSSCQRGRAQVIHDTLVLLERRPASARPAWTR